MSDVKIAHREELIFLLNQAAELEHSLSCSYFFTALSLKRGAEEEISEEALKTVSRWRRELTGIAIEEMMHLAVVNDLLVAVGAAPHFDRPNFPHDCAYYMPELEIGLQPFSEATMRHFIALEQPVGGELTLSRNVTAYAPVEGELVNDIGPDPHLLESQGEIYSMIGDGLRYLVEKLGEESVFVGPPQRNAVKDFFGMYGWGVVRDLPSALKALDHVIEQGEGGTSVTENSHHARFSGILSEYLAMKAEDPAFAPARPLLSNPFTRTPPEAQGPVNLITHEYAIHVSDLFNEAYVVMLNLLGRFFVTTEESESDTSRLCDAAIEMMRGTILGLGDILARLPASDGDSMFNAGPSFVVRTLHALPHRKAAWHLMNERLVELADYAGSIAPDAPNPSAMEKVQASMGRAARMLS